MGSRLVATRIAHAGIGISLQGVRLLSAPLREGDSPLDDLQASERWETT